VAEFGAFQVNRACRHAFGHLEMELEPGRYEPASLEEYEAMEHLVGVPVPPGPDGAPGEPFASKLENPNGAPDPETGVVRRASYVEPALPEPPTAGAALAADGSADPVVGVTTEPPGEPADPTDHEE
jgi:hypothetical protein